MTNISTIGPKEFNGTWLAGRRLILITVRELSMDCLKTRS